MMDTATAARAIGGTLSGPNVAFDRVTTDSRSLKAGDLFVALKGERFDGHDFVAQAFAGGAVAAVVATERAGSFAAHSRRKPARGRPIRWPRSAGSPRSGAGVSCCLSSPSSAATARRR